MKQYLQSWERDKQQSQWPMSVQYAEPDDVHHSQTIPYGWGVPLYIIIPHFPYPKLQ